MFDIAEEILKPKRTKIFYRTSRGIRTGYAWLGDNEYIWVFDSPQDICGFTIHRSRFIEVCERR